MKKLCLLLLLVFILSGCLWSKPELKKGIILHDKNIRSSYIAGNTLPWMHEIILCSNKNLIYELGAHKLLVIDTVTGKEKIITYELQGPDPKLVFLSNKLNIINTGSDAVGLMNEDGKLIWKYPPNPEDITPYDIEAWRLNGGGAEYYVATASRGVLVLDENGRYLRQIGSGYIANIEFCKYKKDDAIIAHAYPTRQFYIWDFNGSIKQKIVTKKFYTNFTIVNWPGDYNILVDDGKSFYVLDFNGKILFEWKNDFPILDLKGTGIYLQKGEKYFAVITTSKLPESLSILWIFSPNGELVYKEVICRTVALQAVNDDLTDRDYLLVGDCKLRKYQMP